MLIRLLLKIELIVSQISQRATDIMEPAGPDPTEYQSMTSTSPALDVPSPDHDHGTKAAEKTEPHHVQVTPEVKELNEELPMECKDFPVEHVEKSDQSSPLFKAPINITPLRRVNKQTAPAFSENSPNKTKETSDQTSEKQVERTNKSDIKVENISENNGTTGKPNQIAESQQTGKVAAKSLSLPMPSPAEQLKLQQVPIPYKEPTWGGLCPKAYSFEVIKNGTVVDNIELTTKSYYVFGRLPSCDVTMEHPSLSRYHAVIQYCSAPNEHYEVGWYLYDLDSTHGTWVNKHKVRSRIFVRLRVGYVVKLGGSTRLNILQGPDVDQDAESELSISEMKEQRQRQEKEAEVLRRAEQAGANELLAQPDQGCSWGMDSTDPEEIDAVNPFALEPEPQNEDLYIEDPKKALRGFFEREGYDLPEYEVVEDTRGKYKCRVELPIDGPLGEPIVAEVSVSGKKREAVAACALEACRILDRHGELRKSTHESRAKKRKNWEDDDFYASDDDTFLDRTGDIEKKRKQRMKREHKTAEKAETYDSLTNKIEEIDKEVHEIEEKLQKAKDQAAAFEEEGLDVFDAYMSALKSGALDTKSKTQFKRKIFDLKQEKQKLEKLANVARPALPKLSKPSINTSSFGALFGKMKHSSGKGKPVRPVVKKAELQPIQGQDEMEEEQEEDDEEEDKPSTREAAKSEITSRIPAPLPQAPCTDTDSTSSDKKTCSDSSHSTQAMAKDSFQSESAMETKDNCDAKQMDISLIVSADASHSAHTESTVVSGHSAQHPNKNPDKPDVKALPSSDSPSVPQVAVPSHPSSADKKHKAFVLEKSTITKQDALPQNYTDLRDDPDYATWVPPKGQTGDGRTHLNAKFGY